jgi:MGT family glycosyltransferase
MVATMLDRARTLGCSEFMLPGCEHGIGSFGDEWRQVRPFVAGYDELRRDFGLAPLGSPQALMDQYHAADLRLIQTSSAFDFPITPAPRNVRYVGPVLDDPDWTGAWQNPWPQSDARPLVVASLSTTFQDQSALLQRIVSALGRLPVRALVTLGPAMARERFDVPSNVVTVQSASHALVFPEASAVVTHAGHGTVMRALAHDLPILCLPMGRDQDDNAARVVAHGAGLRLRPSASTRRIAAAVGRLLDDDALRAGARRLGGVIRADVGGDGGVAVLEALAASSGTEPGDREAAT